MLRLRQQRLVVSIDVLRSYNREFATALLYEPNEYLPAFNAALRAVVDEMQGQNDEQDDFIHAHGFYIGLKGSFGENAVSPRTLRSTHLGRMVALEGIITKCRYPRQCV